jgi:hypothetical protein
MGYRFFDKEGITPLFPFGWGLSYTTFKYSGLNVNQAGDGLDVSFDVTNTGNATGATVPQVYVGPAPSVPAGVQQADRSLAGFDRVTLDPGQTKHETIHVGPGADVDGYGNRRAFQYWDTGKQAWVTAPGARKVWVGDADLPANLPLSQSGVTPPTPTGGSSNPGGGTRPGGGTSKPGGGSKHAAGCPVATGRLSARAIGPFKLGMARSRARHVLRRFSTRGRRYVDFFCLKSAGITAGYAYARLVASLPRAERRRLMGRIVVLLTANRRYVLRGVRPGVKARSLRRLRPGRPLRFGANTWYVVGNGASRGIVQVRGGIVQEVGIAVPSLTRTRASARRLIATIR